MLTLKKSAKRIRLSASGKVSPFRNWTEFFDLFPCPELHLSALIRRLCAEHESLIAPFLTPPEKYHIEFITLYNRYTKKSVKRNTYIKKTVNYTACTKILVGAIYFKAVFGIIYINFTCKTPLKMYGFFAVVL